ncbi:unnamed protein product [Cylindrotheca closterium]|uniref:BZIP domain-containing protein n=1 Tax=Cylindrotheca closterium TaxID=2856 RepID=A0AAD2CSI8_9STRA|nr:unnamed protein product [Cylindrotheca closterium]
MEKNMFKSPQSPSLASEDTDDEATTEGKEGNLDTTSSCASASGADDNVLKNRREKRLAMNRASARARRRRKKDLLGSLAAQVQELTNQKHMLQTKNDSLSSRVEKLESALTQAQATITSLSSGAPSVQSSLFQPLASSAPPSSMGQMSESALRSILLSAGAGLQASAGGLQGAGCGGGYGGAESLFNPRAMQQQLDLQNQLKLLGATAGFGGAGGLGGLQQQASALQQHLTSERIGSLGALLGGGLGQGMAPTASQLDSLVRAKAMEQTQEDVRMNGSMNSNKIGAASNHGMTDSPPGKRQKI